MVPVSKRLRTEKKFDTRKKEGEEEEYDKGDNQSMEDTSSEASSAEASSDAGNSDNESHNDIKSESEDEEERGQDNDRKPRIKVGSNNTLFIRSLSYDTSAESLTTHFSFIAPVKHAHIVLDPNTKKSRGFGFVTFAEDEDANRAVQEMNGRELDGRKLKVEIAQPRHRSRHGFEDQGEEEQKSKIGKEEVEKRNPRLIIRNLPWSIKKPEQLEEVFKKFGKVKNVILPPKKGAPPRAGLLSGFAFVTMKRYRHAQKAIEEMNGKQLDGRPIAVDWALEKDRWEKIKEEGGDTHRPMVDEESDSSDDEMEIKQEEVEEDGMNEHIDDTSDKSDDEPSEVDSDMDDGENGDDGDEDQEIKHDNSLCLFLRNVPFSVTDQTLHAHFTEHFGPVRYARIVMDWETERPRGTAFVAFYNEEHFSECLRNTPKPPPPGSKPSLLQNESQDPDGKYTIDGRILVVTKAVDKSEAGTLAERNQSMRKKVMEDKRRLYLLMEGNIPSNVPLYKLLSPSERAIREASLKQRKSLIQNNPSLHLSLTRLSIRNIPRSITAKDLKFLAREAVVGFSADVKAGKRAALSKEELARGGEEEKLREQERKRKGKGVIRQVKIIEEQSGGTGHGRSKGYGFIEYVSHRWALMGLRWLNAREVGGGLELPIADIPGRREKLQKAVAAAKKGSKSGKNSMHGDAVAPNLPKERKKRLIVEFALENAQVVHRRKETEEKWRKIAAERKAAATAGKNGSSAANGDGKRKSTKGKGWLHGKQFRTGERKNEVGKHVQGKKRKRPDNENGDDRESKRPAKGAPEQAKANRIIAKKRRERKARAAGK